MWFSIVMLVYQMVLVSWNQARNFFDGFRIWLVVLTILKNIKVNGKDDIPYSMENRRCLKPPTSIISIYIYIIIYIYSNENWKGKTTWFGFGTWESERIPRNPCRVFEMFPMKITICWVFGIPHFRSFQMCPLEKEVQFSLSTQA